MGSQQIEQRLAGDAGHCGLCVGVAEFLGESAARGCATAIVTTTVTVPGTTGRSAGGTRSEEDAGPSTFEDAGSAVFGTGRGVDVSERFSTCGRSDAEVGEQGLAQVVPGDGSGHRVHAGVCSACAEGQCPAVRSACHADVGITRSVELYFGLFGQPVDQAAGIGDLAIGVVDGDGTRAVTEAARGVGENHVSARGEITSFAVDRVLAAAEAVREQHSRSGGGLGNVEPGVEVDGLRRTGAVR